MGMNKFPDGKTMSKNYYIVFNEGGEGNKISKKIKTADEMGEIVRKRFVDNQKIACKRMIITRELGQKYIDEKLEPNYHFNIVLELEEQMPVSEMKDVVLMIMAEYDLGNKVNQRGCQAIVDVSENSKNGTIEGTLNYVCKDANKKFFQVSCPTQNFTKDDVENHRKDYHVKKKKCLVRNSDDKKLNKHAYLKEFMVKYDYYVCDGHVYPNYRKFEDKLRLEDKSLYAMYLTQIASKSLEAYMVNFAGDLYEKKRDKNVIRFGDGDYLVDEKTFTGKVNDAIVPRVAYVKKYSEMTQPETYFKFLNIQEFDDEERDVVNVGVRIMAETGVKAKKCAIFLRGNSSCGKTTLVNTISQFYDHELVVEINDNRSFPFCQVEKYHSLFKCTEYDKDVKINRRQFLKLLEGNLEINLEKKGENAVLTHVEIKTIIDTNFTIDKFKYPNESGEMATRLLCLPPFLKKIDVEDFYEKMCDQAPELLIYVLENEKITINYEKFKKNKIYVNTYDIYGVCTEKEKTIYEIDELYI